MMTDASAPKGERLLRLPQVRELTGLGTTKLYELIASDEFPRPVHLTRRSVAWPENEVAEWTRARIAERDAKMEQQRARENGRTKSPSP